MKRPSAAADGTGKAPEHGSTLSSLPSLYSYLTDSKWEDGSPRELATLMIFAQDGRWKVCLSDKATGRVCFLSGTTIEEALLSLDEGLGTDEVDWRTAGSGQGRKK